MFAQCQLIGGELHRVGAIVEKRLYIDPIKQWHSSTFDIKASKKGRQYNIEKICFVQRFTM